MAFQLSFYYLAVCNENDVYVAALFFTVFIFIYWALRQNLENEYVTLVAIFYCIFVIECYSVTTV